MKVSQNDQIQMSTSFRSVFLMNGVPLIKKIRSFIHFQIFTWIAYSELRRNLEKWPILKFVFIHFKAVKVSQNDQIQMWTSFRSVFLMNGVPLIKKIRSFSHFPILTWIAYSDLSRNLEKWPILKFVFILCKTVKASQVAQIRM